MRRKIERETDGRFALKLSSKQSYQRFQEREAERNAKRQAMIDELVAKGWTLDAATDEAYLFAV